MRQKMCARERAVANAARMGMASEDLLDHVTTCAVCKDVMSAATAMRSLAVDLETDSGLPDARWLWRRRLLEEKETEMAQAQRPIHLVECGSVLTVLVLGGWITWLWVQASGSALVEFTVLQAEFWPRLWQAIESLMAETHLSPDRPVLLIVLLAIAVVIATRPLLAEE